MLSNVKQELTKELQKKYKIPKEKIMYSFSVPKEEFGDLATNISFIIAKEKKQNPKEISEEIGKLLKKSEWVKEVKILGPYVNLFLSNKFYSEALNKIKKEREKYGKGKNKNNKIMIEFFHANTHKGVHIGHIRNISIGESLSRIMEFAGNNIIRVNYQGDIGPHVAKCLWGFINLHNQKAPKENKGVWLGKVYSEASKKIKENDDLEEEVQEINQNLYAKEKNITEIWKKTRQWCLDDFEEFYKEFGVKFNELYFESQSEIIGKKTALKLLEKGIAKKDQGAVIMDLKEDNLGVFLLLTKAGYPLYSAKDIGLAKMKFEKYDLDKSIHVVGKEQELYFKQLFKTFEKAGMNKIAKASYHLIYELVMLPEGKMSSREGTMILYEDLKNKLIEITEKEVRKRHKDWKEKEVKEIAKEIALGAIKFSMLKREANKQLIFDWEEALKLEGDSGPYLQYAYVRTNGILKKIEKKEIKPSEKHEFNTEEKNLIKKLCAFSELIEKNAENLAVHSVPDYLLDVSSYFNKFYNSSPVLKEKGITKQTRLAIVDACGIVLKNGLFLMGIKAIEKM